MRKLCSDSQDHQDGANRAGILRRQAGRICIACIKLISQPIFFDVKIIGLCIFEEYLDKEVGDKTGRKTGD